jgi:hypothetical protein
VTLDACLEFVAPTGSMSLIADVLPVTPGGVAYDDAGCPLALHVALRRWLVPNPAEALRRKLLAFQTGGLGAIAEVDGKWQWLRMEGSAGLRLLESTVESETLGGRACASVNLFDCPAIVARRGDRFDAWIAASYF